MTRGNSRRRTKRTDVMFIETSAKAGYNGKQLFQRATAALSGMGCTENKPPEDMKDIVLKDSPYESGNSGGARVHIKM